MDTQKEITAMLNEAETKAWESLSGYKFVMFGYWAAVWVHLNRLEGCKRPNPWSGLVRAAKWHIEAQQTDILASTPNGEGQ